MVDQGTARALLRLADETQALVMLVGDRHQLPAVGRGGVLDLAIRYAPDRVQQLDGVRRFKDPRYAKLSLQMRSGAQAGEVFRVLDTLKGLGDVAVRLQLRNLVRVGHSTSSDRVRAQCDGSPSW